MSITLVVLAAGIGSRYGGLKQIDPVGPSGEIVIDYSVFDALRAGFDSVLCVIRRDIEKDFREAVSARFEKHVPVHYVFQDMADLPSGFAVPADRKKPWGTAHALRACRRAVNGPFAVINADDFYGRRSYDVLAEFLRRQPLGGTDYGMVGFVLRNTLSEHGSVARGICDVAPDGLLRSVVERTKIEKDGNAARFDTGDGVWHPLNANELVSMNMWGFTPTIFARVEEAFPKFLGTAAANLKAEFFIPSVVDTLIRSRQATCRVLETPAQWFGVTYPADKPHVVAQIRELVARGEYPARLWT